MRLNEVTMTLFEQTIIAFSKDKTLTESTAKLLYEMISDALYQSAKRYFDQCIQDEIVPVIGEEYFVLIISLIGGAEQIIFTQTSQKVTYVTKQGNPTLETSTGKTYTLSRNYYFRTAISHVFFLNSTTELEQFLEIWLMKFMGQLKIERYELDTDLIQHAL